MIDMKWISLSTITGSVFNYTENDGLYEYYCYQVLIQLVKPIEPVNICMLLKESPFLCQNFLFFAKKLDGLIS